VKLTDAALQSSATGNYAYVTARVRARETKLIPATEYQKLLAMDVFEISRYIQEGNYKREVDELAAKYRGAALIERAGRLRLARTYQEVIRWSTGDIRRMVLLYLQRYDVYNVKTILRGRFAGVSDEEIASSLIPAGALSADDLKELLRFQSLEESVAALQRTPYGAALGDGVAGDGGLAKAENALDMRYYELLLASVEPNSHANRALLAFLRAEVDAINLKTVIRARVAGLEDVGEYLLKGGKEISGEVARRMLRATPEEAARELESTRFAPVADAVKRTLETSNLNAAVTAIDKLVLDSSSTFSNRYPLSILPIIDFVVRQRIETDNLRIIARGKQTGLREETLKELIRVVL